MNWSKWSAPIVLVLLLLLIPLAWTSEKNSILVDQQKKISPPGTVPGIVVAHLSAANKKYIGSPAIVKLDNGELLVSHDIFGPEVKEGLTTLYASKDGGKSWQLRAKLNGQFWSSLFVHNKNIYLFGVDKPYGSIVIRKSTDGGTTWSEPVNESSGLLFHDAKYHTAPCPVVIFQDRIWRAFEDAGAPGTWPRHFRSLILSAPVDSDLLQAKSWSKTNALASDANWLNGTMGGWLEGNVVVSPEQKLCNLIRVHQPNLPEIIARISYDIPNKKIHFDPKSDFLTFPGGAKKFTIRYDPQSKKYWSLTNWVPLRARDKGKIQPIPGYLNPASTRIDRCRNLVALISSNDLQDWQIRTILLEHPDQEKHAFQYLDWLIDGNDILAVARTAYDDKEHGAANQHDANYMTFHRFQNFRQLSMLDRVAGFSRDYPVSGNCQIRNRSLDSDIVITTTNRVAGAIDSLKWRGKEFINSTDHGRQLQSAANFDFGKPFHPEVFNPTEAGSAPDHIGNRSSSRVLLLETAKNSLLGQTQMAFWLAPGGKSQGYPATNQTIVSRHVLLRSIKIGLPHLPQAIRYDVSFFVPDKEHHTFAQFESLTGYMPKEFSQFWRYDSLEKKLLPLSKGPGEQKDPVVLSTADKKYAMGCLALDSPPPGFTPNIGYGRFHFEREKVNKWNVVYRYRNAKGIEPGEYSFRHIVLVGTFEMVEDGLRILLAKNKK